MSSAIANGLAGAGGGLIAQIITYPLQTVNTRQQTERVRKKGHGDVHETLPSKSHPSRGTLVIKTEGWGELYSGLKPSLFGTVASLVLKSISLHVEERLRIVEFLHTRLRVYINTSTRFSRTRLNQLQWLVKPKDLVMVTSAWLHGLLLQLLLGGQIEISLNVLLTNPIWVLVTRMQTHTQAEREKMERNREALLKEASESSGMDASTLEERLSELNSMEPKSYGTLHAATEVYKEAGIRGFWKGIVPTLIMVCNPSIQFMIYETSTKSLRQKQQANKHGKKEITALEVFVLGAVAKLGATVATYPLLVVRKYGMNQYKTGTCIAHPESELTQNSIDLNMSRLQAKQDISSNVSYRYSGMLDAIIKMIRYEGLFGFYKGMSTKIVQSVFAAAVLFMVKQELVNAFTIAEKSRKIRVKTVK
ncbi:hypothetical protein Cgig2_009063 [Carnegiea gigantea]|uniref:Peroxisomal nicotinamide adenine dinucleotide carrier n=1 Tax=Carnegiea gigantea TaxID=171969 RepID=A0A9Q1JTN4_9CARY|nr:hypothetical protein Cgig2_009063 [Carnegiea gigantea]